MSSNKFLVFGGKFLERNGMFVIDLEIKNLFKRITERNIFSVINMKDRIFFKRSYLFYPEKIL